MSNSHIIFAANDIEDNKNRAVDIDGKSILICKSGGEFFALDNMCTHQRAELEGGRIRNCFLSCPLHGIRFDLRTGEPKGDLTRIPVKTYPISINNDGNLVVDMNN